ncbi:MAG: hypothetical protein GF398_21350 [Chitinivibrionales bacterium]|nr:hypothetical protein [Chitinivibrionales bacterium]
MIHFNEKLETDKIYQLLNFSIPYYLKAWQEQEGECGLFGTTDPSYFSMKAVASSSPVIEYVVRPHVHVLCVLAAYFYKNKQDVLQEFVPVQECIDMLVKGIRWMCRTHLIGELDVPVFLERKRWGENWRSSLWAGLLGLCGHMVKAHIPQDLYDNICGIVAFEADRFIDILPPSGCEVDTKLEENAQDALILAWAINMLPGHPHISKWETSLKIWALNIATSIHDKADHSDYYGKSVSGQITTQTLFPDMTAENHGFFHPLVMSYSSWIVMAATAYSFHGNRPPEFLLKKHHQQTFDILLKFCLPNGMIYEPGGQDLPIFIPRPFALAWGIWNCDPRAQRMTAKLLEWMDEVITGQKHASGQWVLGFDQAREGWELFFQSQAGFELAMLAVVPVESQHRLFSLAQIDKVTDTRDIYNYVELCYRRNTRTTRSVAWKAIGNHPILGLGIHSQPELIAPFKAGLLGIPSTRTPIKKWEVAFHHDRTQKDGFDTFGRIIYYDAGNEPKLKRDIRAITWGDEGLVVFDQITAEQELFFNEQYLSPIYLVNDYWTGNSLHFHSGSLREVFVAQEKQYREISCPSFWAGIENHLLFQFLWGRTKGLIYLPGGKRNAPAYWENCRLDMLAVRVESKSAHKGDIVYQVGYYVGAAKGPRPFKAAGTAGEFFKGLVIMDGKNTTGLD